MGTEWASHLLPTWFPHRSRLPFPSWFPRGSHLGRKQVGTSREPGVNQVGTKSTRREQGRNQAEAGPGENHDGASPVAGWESGKPGGTWGDLVGATLGVVKHLRLESATNQLADQAPGWGKGVGCAGCGDILRLGAGNGGVGPTLPILRIRPCPCFSCGATKVEPTRRLLGVFAIS